MRHITGNARDRAEIFRDVASRRSDVGKPTRGVDKAAPHVDKTALRTVQGLFEKYGFLRVVGVDCTQGAAAFPGVSY